MTGLFNHPVSPIAKNFVSPFPVNSHLMPPKSMTDSMPLGKPMGTGKWKFAVAQLQAEVDRLKQSKDG